MSLIEDLDHAANMLEASPLENTLPLAARLRDAARRLREEMERVGDNHEDVTDELLRCALERINGTPTSNPETCGTCLGERQVLHFYNVDAERAALARLTPTPTTEER